MGDADKATHHYKQGGGEAGSRGIELTRSLCAHLTKLSDARKRNDWHSMLKEAQAAVSSGAESAPQVNDCLHSPESFDIIFINYALVIIH